MTKYIKLLLIISILFIFSGKVLAAPVADQACLGRFPFADTFISAYKPDTRFGWMSYFETEKWSSFAAKVGLIKFDLQDIPCGAYVKSANLRLFVNNWSGNPLGGGAGNMTLNVLQDRCTEYISDGNLSAWYSFFYHCPQNYSYITTSPNITSQGYLTVDLTEHFRHTIGDQDCRQWWVPLIEGYSIYTNKPNTGYQISSREAEANAQPCLTIDWSVLYPTPAPKADLVIEDISLKKTELPGFCTGAYQFDILVKNIGTENAPYNTLKTVINPAQPEAINDCNPFITNGGSEVILPRGYFITENYFPPGSHELWREFINPYINTTVTVTAYADYGNRVPEANESNNTLTKTFTILRTTPTPTPTPTVNPVKTCQGNGKNGKCCLPTYSGIGACATNTRIINDTTAGGCNPTGIYPQTGWCCSECVK